MSKPLLVLDTNVVLDLFHFDDAVVSPLRQALESGHVRCAVTPATLEELRRVLAYPEFSLSSTRQQSLLNDYVALAIPVEAVDVDAALPVCSDPDDQKFLELAAVAGAQGLVSKDRAVLKLRRRCAPHFRIMTPAEAALCLGEVAD